MGPQIWVFPKMVVPPKHPKMIIFSRKTNGCWVPPFTETPKYAGKFLRFFLFFRVNDSWEAKDHPWEALGGMGGGADGIGWTGEIPQIAGAQNPPLKLS